MRVTGIIDSHHFADNRVKSKQKRLWVVQRRSMLFSN